MDDDAMWIFPCPILGVFDQSGISIIIWKLIHLDHPSGILVQLFFTYVVVHFPVQRFQYIYCKATSGPVNCPFPVSFPISGMVARYAILLSLPYIGLPAIRIIFFFSSFFFRISLLFYTYSILALLFYLSVG